MATITKQTKTLHVCVAQSCETLLQFDITEPYATQALAAFYAHKPIAFEQDGYNVVIPFEHIYYVTVIYGSVEAEKKNARFCEPGTAPSTITPPANLKLAFDASHGGLWFASDSDFQSFSELKAFLIEYSTQPYPDNPQLWNISADDLIVQNYEGSTGSSNDGNRNAWEWYKNDTVLSINLENETIVTRDDS